MIREVMEANGYRKTGKLRAVPPEPRRLFVRAEVFERAPLPREPKTFDWDRYVMAAPFHQVRQLSSVTTWRVTLPWSVPHYSFSTQLMLSPNR